MARPANPPEARCLSVSARAILMRDGPVVNSFPLLTLCALPGSDPAD